MKFIITAIIMLLQSQMLFANAINCSSEELSPDGSAIQISGTAEPGQKINLEKISGINFSLSEILVTDVSATNEQILISGVASDRLFIGGNTLKMKLAIPNNNNELAQLKIATPISDLDYSIEAQAVRCSIEASYHILPIQQ